MVPTSPHRLILPSLLATGPLLFLGCGGGGGGTPTPAPPPAANTTATQVNFGDAPADWLMAFGMTVDSVVMTDRSGGTTSLVAAPTPMEMTQTMGTMQPVSVKAVPQGTYTQAVVTFSGVSMGYLDPISHAYTQKTLPGPFMATVPFSPGLTVGTTPMALNFDMDMASSVAIDGSGNVTLTPVMTASAATVPASGASAWSGAMRHQVGRVSAVSGSSFTMGSMMGIQTSTFAISGSTQFTGTGLSALAGMGAGMIVAVDATLQPDGSLLAQRVEAMGAGTAGMMGGGLVNAITGNPPTQFTLVANGGMGGGMMASSMGSTLTVSLPAAVPYSYDTDGMDLASLPFVPAFGPATLAKGQRVEAVSTSGMMGGGMMGGTGTLSATQVRLEQQGLHGTVSGYSASGSQATFTLALPANSAFAILTGASSIQVYQQAGTQLFNLASVGNGSDLIVRGLLFYNGTAYQMVASWMVAP